MDAATLVKFLRSATKFNRVFEKVKILSVGNGKCLAELKIDESHTNPSGNLHEGLSFTMIDTLSTCAANSLNPSPHVSVDIHVSYLKSAKIGDEVIIDASVSKMGQNLCYSDIEIKNKKTGDLLVKGTQTGFIVSDSQSVLKFK